MLTTNVGLATQWPLEVALSGARMNEIENDTSGNARGGGGQSVGQALIQSRKRVRVSRTLGIMHRVTLFR